MEQEQIKTSEFGKFIAMLENEKSEGITRNCFFLLKRNEEKSIPKPFKDEMKINDYYQHGRYIVRMAKHIPADDTPITYSIYLKTNLFCKRGDKIGGSGRTIEEAKAAFFENIRQIKFPTKKALD